MDVTQESMRKLILAETKKVKKLISDIKEFRAIKDPPDFVYPAEIMELDALLEELSNTIIGWTSADWDKVTEMLNGANG